MNTFVYIHLKGYYGMFSLCFCTFVYDVYLVNSESVEYLDDMSNKYTPSINEAHLTRNAIVCKHITIPR